MSYVLLTQRASRVKGQVHELLLTQAATIEMSLVTIKVRLTGCILDVCDGEGCVCRVGATQPSACPAKMTFGQRSHLEKVTQLYRFGMVCYVMLPLAEVYV